MARAITTSERLIPPTSLIDLNMTRNPVSSLELPSRVQEGTIEITRIHYKGYQKGYDKDDDSIGYCDADTNRI